MDVKVILDEFRISHIFDIEEPIPEGPLVAGLEKRGYAIIRERVISHPPIRAILLNIASKNNVKVTYQKETIPTYVGVAGKVRTEVLKQFDTLDNVLTEIDPTLHTRQTSTESIFSAKVFGRSSPSETISSFATESVSKFDKL